ncbi:transcriptional regulator [Nocardia sp. BSTN01]|uniref:winged helix-turn-helix transcriptional regulator n=1 Tax=Nocardia sp. BSTN01 TaxID=2783665 RepID=UPI00188DFC1F|nr:winged helix-turn-helix transcriptional regulator [Nocardia sp. BSTN01]MBF5001522.1 transcriptional regulator [Nocardia sp. BSTN01]
MRSYRDPCGVARALDIVGERWALLVVRDLLLGPKRFNDLLDGLPGVSPNVLSQRLRELTECGVVQRRDLPPPVRVRLYELTEWGLGLEPILLNLGRWGSRAPAQPEGDLGVDSLLLSIKASFESARCGELGDVYEMRIDNTTYLAEITHGSIRISRNAASETPDATLTATLETLRAIWDGRITPSTALRSGALHLDGDEQAGQRLFELISASIGTAPSDRTTSGDKDPSHQ